MKCIAVITCLGLLCGTVFALEDKTGIAKKSTASLPISNTPSSNSTDPSSGNNSVPVADYAPSAPSTVPSAAVNPNNTDPNSPTQTSAPTNGSVTPSPTNGSVTPAPTNGSVTPAPTNGSVTPAPNTESTPEIITTVAPSAKTTPQTPTTNIPSTTPANPTTEKPTPETPSSTTESPITSPNSPTGSPSTSTKPADSSTKSPLTTEVTPSAKPATDRRFDGPSFIGGIVFALGVTAIAFVAWKFYKARTERNYHTL